MIFDDELARLRAKNEQTFGLDFSDAGRLFDEIERLRVHPITREHCPDCSISGHFICSHRHARVAGDAVLLRELLRDARAFVAALTNVDGTGLRKHANDLLPRIDAALGIVDAATTEVPQAAADPWPLLPRSSTMAAIQAARSRLAEVEDTIGRELSYMAAELDRTRTALDAERALRERIAGECADFKARLLERERELLGDVEVRYDEKGRVDEVVAKRCAHVHLEDMEGSWALIFSDGDRTLNLSITSRRAVVVEQAGVREVRP